MIGTEPARGTPVAAHRVALPGGSWALWRCVALRGAGFPARSVLELALSAFAAAADELLAAEARREEGVRQALRAVDRDLDRLRAGGAWEDDDRRRPLLKALRALSRGKLPPGASEGSSPGLLEELRQADRVLAGARARFEAAYEEAVAHASAVLRRQAGSPPFREAVSWQNRHAVETALDALIRRRAEVPRRSQARQHEELAASYLQRYAMKNDTIGFFGPVGWATLEDDGPPVRVRCGPGLVRDREVYFENWALSALAETLLRSLPLRPWLAPRLRSSCWRDGDTVHTALGLRRLNAAQGRLLDACDGVRPARELAAASAADGESPIGSEEEVYRLLSELERQRVVAWGLDVPLELRPERTLREQLARIGDPELRVRALAPLDRLEGARRRVARAAGDAVRLGAELRRLERTFVELTERSASRHHGRTYAARGLVYEDCGRDLEVRFGPRLLHDLGPPLGLVLRGVRWLVAELAREVERELARIHGGLRRGGGDREVASYPFFGQALSSIFLGRPRPPLFERVEREFQRRWARALDLEAERPEAGRVHRDAERVAERAAEVFPAGGPAWSAAYQISPDVLVAAGGEEALSRGDYRLVLGEVHPSATYLASCFVSQHPAPEELARGLESDAGDRVVVFPQMVKENWTQRMTPALFPSGAYQYEVTDVRPGSRPCRGLPAGALVIEAASDGLVARTRDGGLRFAAIDLFSSYLNQECSAIASRPLRPAAHTPRVTIGRVAICREAWNFDASEVDGASERDPSARYLAVRRWARGAGVPRLCFYKVSSERKPCFLDLDVPVLVDLFTRQVTAAAGTEAGTVTISEMLPRPDQLWLRDGEGRYYTSELRLVAVDRREVGV